MKKRDTQVLIVVAVVIVAVGAFLLFSGKGGSGSVLCGSPPQGCEYTADSRVAQDGELAYPCGVLSCAGYDISCTEGQESTVTIQEGRTRVVTGLPIQVGGINVLPTGLSAVVVFGNGGYWSIYEGSLPYNLPRFFTINNQLYSIEPTAITENSLTLNVYCGKKA